MGIYLPKAENIESMNINISLVKFTTKVSNIQSIKITSLEDKTNKKLTLKEMQQKNYPFLDSEIAAIFDELFEMKLFELLDLKRPNEVGRSKDSNYYKYH